MEFIICKPDGIEVGPLKERSYIDIDCGKDNDFEIQISQELYKKIGISDGWRICVPGTEYGGIINRIKNNTGSSKVTISGSTWRGMLSKKIIQPSSGEDYKTVSGDANSIINALICDEFDEVFVCDGESGILFNNYRFDRYVDTLFGVEKMLLSQNARLNISYNSGKENDIGYVEISAVKIEDYSDEIEYSQDGTLAYLSFSFEEYAGGVNHLICLGKGELKDRTVVHLYVQENGTIGNTQFYKGKDEIVSVYDYSSVESIEELTEKGTEQLQKLMSYKTMDMDIYNKSLSGIRGVQDISIGDIVGGRDFDTGIYLSKQITQKIIKVKDGKESIEYKVGEKSKKTSSSGESSGGSGGSSVGGGISILDVYPVGSIYMSANNVNPGTIFGGTWEEWGAGRVPVGVDVNDSNFNGVEKTGGASTHTLSEEQIPMHSHGLNEHTHSIPNLSGKTNNTGNHTHRHGNSNDHGFASFNDSTGETRVGYSTDYVYPAGYNKQTQSTGAHEHTVTTNASTTGKASGNTESVGSGKSHNNLQPYITCYMWKRIA